MSADVPSPHYSRPLKVTAKLAPGQVAVPDDDPLVAAFRVPVARIPISELLEQPVRNSTPPTPSVSPARPTANTAASSKEVQTLIDDLTALLSTFSAAAIDIPTTALPDDAGVLRQMIVELLLRLASTRSGSGGNSPASGCPAASTSNTDKSEPALAVPRARGSAAARSAARCAG